MIETKGMRVDLTGATWVKSSKSGSINCVEATAIGAAVAVRDSKNPDGGVLVFDRAEWLAFIGGVRDGEFEFDA